MVADCSGVYVGEQYDSWQGGRDGIKGCPNSCHIKTCWLSGDDEHGAAVSGRFKDLAVSWWGVDEDEVGGACFAGDFAVVY